MRLKRVFARSRRP